MEKENAKATEQQQFITNEQQVIVEPEQTEPQ
jgi:hypothetical protein